MTMPDSQLGTLEILCQRRMNNILMFFMLKIGYFQQWFLYKNDLRISLAEKHVGIIRL